MLAIGITSLGLIIIFTLKKPTEKEVKAIEDFQGAKKVVFDAIIQALKIDVFVKWLNEKLK